jgi:hypothetical protein
MYGSGIAEPGPHVGRNDDKLCRICLSLAAGTFDLQMIIYFKQLHNKLSIATA